MIFGFVNDSAVYFLQRTAIPELAAKNSVKIAQQLVTASDKHSKDVGKMKKITKGQPDPLLVLFTIKQQRFLSIKDIYMSLSFI